MFRAYRARALFVVSDWGGEGEWEWGWIGNRGAMGGDGWGMVCVWDRGGEGNAVMG